MSNPFGGAPAEAWIYTKGEFATTTTTGAPVSSALTAPRGGSLPPGLPTRDEEQEGSGQAHRGGGPKSKEDEKWVKNLSNHDFTYCTELTVKPHEGDLTLGGYQASSYNAPTVFSRLPSDIETLARLFPTRATNNIDMMIHAEASVLMKAQPESIYIAGIDLLVADSGGLPFPVALVYGEFDSDGRVKEIPLAINHNRTMYGKPCITTLLPRGSGPGEREIFNHRAVLPSKVLSYYGGTKLEDYSKLALREYAEDGIEYVVIPADNEWAKEAFEINETLDAANRTIVDEIIYEGKRKTPTYHITKLRFESPKREQKYVDGSLPRTDLTKGRFFFVRADYDAVDAPGNNAAWSKGTRFQSNDEKPPSESAVYFPVLLLKVAYAYFVKSE